MKVMDPVCQALFLIPCAPLKIVQHLFARSREKQSGKKGFVGVFLFPDIFPRIILTNPTREQGRGRGKKAVHRREFLIGGISTGGSKNDTETDLGGTCYAVGRSGGFSCRAIEKHCCLVYNLPSMVTTSDGALSFSSVPRLFQATELV